jgi:hypothetical protein
VTMKIQYLAAQSKIEIDAKNAAQRVIDGKTRAVDIDLESKTISTVFLFNLMLCVGECELQIRNGTVEGDLELNGATINCDIQFRECVFTGNVKLFGCFFRSSLKFGSSKIDSLDLSGAKISGLLGFNQVTATTASVGFSLRANSTVVIGPFYLTHSEVSSFSGDSFQCESLVFLKDSTFTNTLALPNGKFSSAFRIEDCIFVKSPISSLQSKTNSINLRWAQVRGVLEIKGGQISGPICLQYSGFHGGLSVLGKALLSELIADFCVVGYFLLDDSVVTNLVQMTGIKCIHSLRIHNSSIGQHSSGTHYSSLCLDGAEVYGNFDLIQRTSIYAGSAACISVINAHFRKWFRIRDSNVISSAPKLALAAEAVRIDGQVFLDNASFVGEVDFHLATIGQNFQAIGSNFESTGKRAFTADWAKFKSKFELSSSFTGHNDEQNAFQTALICCVHSTFDGNVSIRGSKVTPFNGVSINLSDSKFRANLEASSSLFEKDVVLDRCVIHGYAKFESLIFDNTANLSMQNTNVALELTIVKIESPPHCINLNSADLRSVLDDRRSWDTTVEFIDTNIGKFNSNCQVPPNERQIWFLNKIASCSSEQKQLSMVRLASTFTAMGEMLLADESRMTGESFRTQAIRRQNAFRFCWRKIQELTSGYGYKNSRLVTSAFVIWLSFAGIYWLFAIKGDFAPTNAIVFQEPRYIGCSPFDRERAIAQENEGNKSSLPYNWYFCSKLREEYTGLSPLLFSLDTLLPIIDLQQTKDWGPLTPTPQTSLLEDVGTWTGGHVLRIFIALQTLAGWILTLLVAQVLTGMVRGKK